MAGEMNFERPLLELREKINELNKFAQDKGMDFTDEIKKLEERLARMEEETYGNLSAWQKTQIARHAQRPTTLDYIGKLFTDFIELHGDRFFGDDLAIVGGIAKFEGRPVTVIGHQKGKDTKENIKRNFGMPHPEGYRKALRLMEQANKFGRPIICFIDTPGAYPGVAAEERGQSEAIARNLREMASFKVPIICIVTGEGGSGGALAIGVGNRVYMLENSIYSVISPEGAATILWRDASQAQRAAETFKITSKDLLSLGVIDGIIPEPQGGAHKDIQFQSEGIRAKLRESLEELFQLNPKELVEDRYQKFKKMGRYTTIS
jgi:acetyl-CoA carboxylase carboxyl transferase subunit alpha